MEKQYVLPMQCKKCGGIFDLWYEFLESEERMNNPEINEKLGRKMAESLCWNCKKLFIKKIDEQVKEDSSELDDLILELSYNN